MESTKLKYYLTSMLISACFGCATSVSDVANQVNLECILDTLIGVNSKSTQILYVSELQGWTDTSSIISVVEYPDLSFIKYRKNLKRGEYRGRTIFYLSGVLSSDDENAVFMDSKKIKSEIKFSKILEGNPDYVERSLNPFDAKQLQFIYTNSHIDTIILGETKIVEAIFENCSFLPNN